MTIDIVGNGTGNKAAFFGMISGYTPTADNYQGGPGTIPLTRFTDYWIGSSYFLVRDGGDHQVYVTVKVTPGGAGNWTIEAGGITVTQVPIQSTTSGTQLTFYYAPLGLGYNPPTTGLTPNIGAPGYIIFTIRPYGSLGNGTTTAPSTTQSSSQPATTRASQVRVDEILAGAGDKASNFMTAKGFKGRDKILLITTGENMTNTQAWEKIEAVMRNFGVELNRSSPEAGEHPTVLPGFVDGFRDLGYRFTMITSDVKSNNPVLIGVVRLFGTLAVGLVMLREITRAIAWGLGMRNPEFFDYVWTSVAAWLPFNSDDDGEEENPDAYYSHRDAYFNGEAVGKYGSEGEEDLDEEYERGLLRGGGDEDMNEQIIGETLGLEHDEVVGAGDDSDDDADRWRTQE